jgi:NAD(P)-dependent dehydrogenase (short-subunit alcohol dehydrogenase family)
VSVLSRFGLDDKVAIVTGASSGLGVAIAKAMGEAGADVAIGARRLERLQETKALVEAAGRRAVARRTDVTAIEDCHALVDAAMDAFGRVDILVNNAGSGGRFVAATDDPPEHFRSVVDLNLHGSYWMAQAAGRVMKQGGSVINVSSVMALTTAKQPAAAYSSSKAALLGLTRDLAGQWGPEKGIRVNAIVPGLFPSEMTEQFGDGWGRKVLDARVPIGRFGDPEECAATAVFLASDASAYITGVALPVDGGFLLR